MTLKITHKHATTTGTLPAASDIDVGELAINAADAEVFLKDTSGKIKRVAASERPLYDSNGALIDPKIPTGVFYSTSEYHEGSSIGGANYKVCASNSASDMGRSFYTYIDHVLPTGQVLKLIPDEQNSVKASQCGCRYFSPLINSGPNDTAKLQAATNFVFDNSGTVASSGAVIQPRGAAVYIEGKIFITDTIFSRSGRVTFIGTNWKSCGFEWAGSESTQPMFNMGSSSTGGFRDVIVTAKSSAGNRAAYCVACSFTDLGFEITRCYLGAARCDVFILYKSFALEVTSGGTNYADGERLVATGGTGSGMLVDITVNSSGQVDEAKISYIGDFKYSPASEDSIYDGTIVTNYQINDVVTVQGGDGNATLKLIDVLPRSTNSITNLTFQNSFLAIGSDRNGYVVKVEKGSGGKRPISFSSCTIVANNSSSFKAGGLLNAVAALNSGFAVNVHSCRIEYQHQNSIYDSTNFALVNTNCDNTSASQRTSIKLSGVVGFISDQGFQDAYIARGIAAGSISLTYDGNLSGFGGILYSTVTVDTIVGGTGYTNAVNVPTTGGTGIGLTVDIKTSNGVISTITVKNGGIGYSVNDTITVTGGNGNGTFDVNTLVDEDFAPKLASTSSVSNAGGLFNDVQFGKSSLISADYATNLISNDGWWIDRGDLVLTSDGEGDYLTPGLEDGLLYSFSLTGLQTVGKVTATATSTNLDISKTDSAVRIRPNLAIRIPGGGATDAQGVAADLDTHVVSVANGDASVGTKIVIANALLSDVVDRPIFPIGAPLRQGWLSPRSTLPSAPAATTGQGLWSQDLQAQAYYVQKDVNITTGEPSSVNKWVWGPTRAVTTTERNAIDYPVEMKSFIGSCVFDITLGQPVWWDGEVDTSTDPPKTGWVDANGNTV